MPSRVIAIGDIHGCAFEFEKLLETIAPLASDKIILLGDLVNKGPHSSRVIEIARRIGAISLLGNHELRLKRYRHTKDISYLKKDDYPTLTQLKASDWDYLESMPITHFDESLNTVFVHGGFLPQYPWHEQPVDVVTRIQVIDKMGRPKKRSDCETCPVWADKWQGPPFVVYGHTPREDVYKTEWSICLDTACVMGGKLSALILPEKKLVQVRAKESYCSE
jgi:hypothetical protein